MTDLQPFLDKAVEAARAAEAIIRRYYHGDFEVEHKADASPVTIADIDGADVKVVSSLGDPNFGGKDFDRKLAALLSEKYKDKCGQALFEEKPDYKLMEDSENLKNQESL